MEIVFDAPVRADDAGEPVGGKRRGQYEKACADGFGSAGGLPDRFDAGDRAGAGKAVGAFKIRGRNDRCAADFRAIMPVLDVADAPLARPGRKKAFDFGEEQRLVGFDGERIIAAALADRRRHVLAAMQGVGGDDAVFKIEQRQSVENALNFIAARRDALGDDEPRLGRPDIDQMQGTGLRAHTRP